MEIKNIGDFMNVAESLEYRYAKTYSKTNPHEYCYATDPDTLEKVRALNKYIQEKGKKKCFIKLSLMYYLLEISSIGVWIIGLIQVS